MIILDTNVISELLRPAPEPKVEHWLSAQDGLNVYLTSISEAELRYGLATMGQAARHAALVDAVDRILREDFAGRILPFDSDAAQSYATIAAARRAAGRPITQADCQIAAIARARGATVATRNTPDLKGCGIDLVNPWTAA
ncbi:VapC ribonuclease Y4jK [Roseovarius sp. EC-HK134]|uniref:type II toxin-antitoxin system VapC family toxin n=1 Tax=unclassified Roseovarius TaxID=2614913 RepID=UPI00125B6D2F|nr:MULTISPECIES: type II toxin-antitoxin system VapC family toxin [unclassified Roseovarius]VVT13299.1 VapC ribonuclease Y4jK [Roseovarius sp. EC-SD190]VVT18437.1 VapC ribonuclease Y4jK [Roseovarius sp. EC-HK134]|tara:strand:- start:743 stop:1165 length:423 start_codon:yes stop_codon:yes gene_type:complete